ncbi:hypothetical protein EDD37DRAFT_604351 [Exophiala viscosa]|uniref:Uncharacterized protein n=1 Tax=Exophiala viscosa TaxID=2486360 RepID=A0AAN6E2I3_9EURO|nr:hypothetical protein EDD36DRAFT_415857 [Exophiala viscosa]KAI1629463.1 hypothetical protein EDD37DRAFT_604351 [Exophiala viscosa]
MNRNHPGISWSMDTDNGLSPTSFEVNGVSPFGYDSVSRHAGSSLQSTPPVNWINQACAGTMGQQSNVPDEPTNTYQDHLFNQLLARITQNPDIACHRDAARRYLALEQELWVPLFQPRWPSEAQKMLSRYLAQEYGVLPASLWQSVQAVRRDPHFELFQKPFVDAVSGSSISQTHSRSGSEISGHCETFPELWAEKATLNPWPSCGTSGASQPSATIKGFGIEWQSSAPAPFPTVRSRRASRSPRAPGTRTAGGRAPAGYKYFCPEPGCQRPDFRNAGNYRNHLRLYHPDTPEHDPTDALRPDIPSEQDELSSSAAPSSGASPLHHRILNDDLQQADIVAPTTIGEAFNFGSHGGFPSGQTEFYSNFAYEDAMSESAVEQDTMSAEYRTHSFAATDGEQYVDSEHGLASETALSFGMFQENLQQSHLGFFSNGRHQSTSESNDSRQ